MGLLKYTTTVTTAKTISDLFSMLQASGSDAIMLLYDEHKEPCGLSFSLQTPKGPLSFKMSVDTTRVKQVLTNQHRLRQVPVATLRDGQPARIAWRIVHDWLEVQLALIQIGLVTLDQVMLPYAVTQDGRTLFDLVQERGGVGKMLGAGKGTEITMEEGR